MVLGLASVARLDVSLPEEFLHPQHTFGYRATMLGFVAGAFAWGAVKSAVTGQHRHDYMDWDVGVGELSEELVFRVGLEKGLGLTGLAPAPVRLLQAGLFGAMHPGNEVDAALGGLLYGAAYDKHGLLGSTLAHIAHNLGVFVAAR